VARFGVVNAEPLKGVKSPLCGCGIPGQQTGQFTHHLIHCPINADFFVGPWGMQHKVSDILI
jgi:hypothetical protein